MSKMIHIKITEKLVCRICGKVAVVHDEADVRIDSVPAEVALMKSPMCVSIIDAICDRCFHESQDV